MNKSYKCLSKKICKKIYKVVYYKMSSIDDAIEKLLRRIERAASKGKWKKVNRLTEQLNQLETNYNPVKRIESIKIKINSNQNRIS